ncbi:LysR family transcriptional regulator [Gordonia sp. CPCC 206044]|uniref:LysR family transcriptional regulator n=1 Tax=Gordonia sp. CPCC 206044 TaxID=3140793 RepID=UPI003AF3FD77
MIAPHAGNALNFQQLQALGAVNEYGSISAAAAELYLTPSAVSQQLQALASNCGFELIERRGRSVRLTRRGLALASLAEEVFSRWERGLESLAAQSDQPVRILRMGALTSAYRTWLGPVVSRIRSTTGVDMELLEVDPDKACKYLIDGMIDMAVSVRIPDQLPMNIQRFPLYSDTFKVVGGIPQPRGTGVAALSDACWVLPESRTYCHEIITAYCTAAGFSPHPIARSNDWGVIQSMAASLEAVALVPESCLSETPGLSVFDIDADELPDWPIELITRADIAHKPEFHPIHRLIAQLAPITEVL